MFDEVGSGLTLFSVSCGMCSADGIDIREHECGQFLYFDKKRFELFHECERDSGHDERLAGKWDTKIDTSKLARALALDSIGYKDAWDRRIKK